HRTVTLSPRLLRLGKDFSQQRGLRPPGCTRLAQSLSLRNAPSTSFRIPSATWKGRQAALLDLMRLMCDAGAAAAYRDQDQPHTPGGTRRSTPPGTREPR